MMSFGNKKQMKKIQIIIICLFISTLAFSQKVEWRETAWQKNQIKFSPLRTINWYNPGLELNYQRNHGQFASQISVAYLTNIADIFTIAERKNIHGYRLNFEEKYYFPKSIRYNMRTFISSELGYNNINSIRESQRFIPLNAEGEDDEENSYIEDWDLNRQSIIFDVKMGMEFRVNHLLLEWGVGFGLTHQYVQVFSKRNPTDQMDFHHSDIISPLFEKEGRYVIPNFPITFKIGYIF